ncbi:MAG: hypothetical protein OHK0044_11400 [Burkholderiaceae bacterium]
MSERTSQPSARRALGALVVVLHTAVVVAALYGTNAVPRSAAPRAVTVRLIDAPVPAARPQSPQPPPPLTFALKPLTPPPVTVPLPEVPEVPPLPLRPAITAAVARGFEPAPAAPSAPAPSDDGGAARSVAAPVLIERVAYARFEPPPYPPLSRRLGEQGVVVLRVVIDEHGVPLAVDVHRSSGYARLDEAARDAVRRARFRPYRDGERARSAIALVPVRFELT